MPNSATITAYWSFTPNTKARAVQVNTNFNNLRGHILPISPTSANGTDQEYDLGVSDYRWRVGYVNQWSLSISLGAADILAGTTAGGFKFSKSGTNVFAIESDQFQGHNWTPNNPTTTAAIAGWAQSLSINSTLTVSGNITGSTCTLSTNGRPVFVGIKNANDTIGAAGLYLAFLTTTSDSDTSSTYNFEATTKLSLMENGATLATHDLGSGGAVSGTTSSDPVGRYMYPAGCFGIVYFPAAGTYKYSLSIDLTTTVTNVMGIELQNAQVFAIELQG